MNLDIKKTAIYYNPKIEGSSEFADFLKDKFKDSKVFSIFDIEESEIPSFVIVVGGDGTILRCARHFSAYGVPIFGFNMGRLGFLAQAQPKEVDTILEEIKNNKFKIEDRIMLVTKINGEKYYALNDIVIKGGVFSRTSTYELFINNTYTSSYLADGIIISTPTGSTAYQLSAGGPVISPNLESFSIVPICPHTLNARPIIVSSNELITIKTEDKANNKYKITFDGQKEFEINNSIEIKRSNLSAKLLLLDREQNNFYNIIREKFGWGIKPKK